MHHLQRCARSRQLYPGDIQVSGPQEYSLLQSHLSGHKQMAWAGHLRPSKDRGTRVLEKLKMLRSPYTAFWIVSQITKGWPKKTTTKQTKKQTKTIIKYRLFRNLQVLSSLQEHCIKSAISGNEIQHQTLPETPRWVTYQQPPALPEECLQGLTSAAKLPTLSFCGSSSPCLLGNKFSTDPQQPVHQTVPWVHLHKNQKSKSRYQPACSTQAPWLNHTEIHDHFVYYNLATWPQRWLECGHALWVVRHQTLPAWDAGALLNNQTAVPSDGATTDSMKS